MTVQVETQVAAQVAEVEKVKRTRTCFKNMTPEEIEQHKINKKNEYINNRKNKAKEEREAKEELKELSKMTPEEAKEFKRKKQRDYMAKRRSEEPEFAQKQKELAKKWRQTPEVKERERIRNRNRDRSNYFVERYKMQKEKYNTLLKDIEEMEKRISDIN